MNYLYLEQQRFDDKLQVIYRIKVTNFRIPALTLQPLVENAVQHGVLNRRNGGTVTIRTEENDDCALVTVSDNGVGMDKARQIPSTGEHSHIGIENVRSRLKESVGGSLEITSSGQGTTAEITHSMERGRWHMRNTGNRRRVPSALTAWCPYCGELLPDAEIFAYSWPYDALEKANECGFDIAFPGCTDRRYDRPGAGCRAEEGQGRDMHIVFVTGYSQYAVDAFAVQRHPAICSSPPPRRPCGGSLTSYTANRSRRRDASRSGPSAASTSYVDGAPGQVRPGEIQGAAGLPRRPQGALRQPPARPTPHCLRTRQTRCLANHISAR